MGNPFQALDALASRLFMTWGFTIAFAAVLPALLIQFLLPQTVDWIICNLVAGAATGAINILSNRAAEDSRRAQFHTHLAARRFGLFIALVLLVNATAPFPAQVPAIYAAGLTLYMIEASFAFVQHFGFMLIEMHRATDKR